MSEALGSSPNTGDRGRGKKREGKKEVKTIVNKALVSYDTVY